MGVTGSLTATFRHLQEMRKRESKTATNESPKLSFLNEMSPTKVAFKTSTAPNEKISPSCVLLPYIISRI